MRHYAGIGSRSTPASTLKLMERIAVQLAAHDWILRSGHAPGADQAFGRGAKTRAQIFLPWPSFEKTVPIEGVVYERPSDEAYEIAARFHPAWERCSRGARMLHARNSHQILGPNLDDPVDFVVCWTGPTGGTQQALRVAQEYEISISNLHGDKEKAVIEEWLLT